MATKLTKRNALIAKVETTYGTDSTPTGAANAMYVYNLKLTAMANARSNRLPARPFFGQDVPAIGNTPVKIEFDVPIAGGGAAGTAPGYGDLLLACGRAATTSAGVSVAYAPISGSFQSASIYVNIDGVQHKITGARGNCSIEFAHNAIPMYKFVLTGIYNAPADVALPALTFGATWPKPLVQNAANTTFSLLGFTAVLSKFSYDTGYSVDWKDWVNNTEQVRITDRANVKGSCSIQADAIAAKDWFTGARGGTTGAVSLVHGTTAGNKWTLAGANVLVTDPSYEDEGGIRMLKLGLEFYPSSAGNDEFSETVT